MKMKERFYEAYQQKVIGGYDYPYYGVGNFDRWDLMNIRNTRLRRFLKRSDIGCFAHRMAQYCLLWKYNIRLPFDEAYPLIVLIGGTVGKAERFVKELSEKHTDLIPLLQKHSSYHQKWHLRQILYQYCWVVNKGDFNFDKFFQMLRENLIVGNDAYNRTFLFLRHKQHFSLKGMDIPAWLYKVLGNRKGLKLARQITPKHIDALNTLLKQFPNLKKLNHLDRYKSVKDVKNACFLQEIIWEMMNQNQQAAQWLSDNIGLVDLRDSQNMILLAFAWKFNVPANKVYCTGDLKTLYFLEFGK